MPVELQGDFVASRFWQDLRAAMAGELTARGLDGWNVTLRPRAREDDHVLKDPAEYGLARPSARGSGRHHPDMDVNKASRAVTFAVPDDEKWADPEDRSGMTAGGLAWEWANDIEIAVSY